MAKPKLTQRQKTIKANQRKQVAKIVRQNASALVSRMQLANRLGKSFNGARDVYASFGYPLIPEYTDYQNFYEREGIATRVVDIVSDETWRINPVLTIAGQKRISETDEPSELQVAFAEMADTHDLYTIFNDVDAALGASRFSLIFIGFDGRLDQPVQVGSRIHYVTYRHEGNVLVEEQTLVNDTESPRFGMPEYYQIVVDERTGASKRVHYSRVIHVKQGRTSSRVYGVPSLKNILNRLYDLEKVVGAGSEAFWQLIHRGMAFTANENAVLPDVDSPEYKKMQDEIDEYMHNLRRYMRLQGVDVNDLGGKPVDNMQQFLSIMAYICGAKGIPKRILLGAEAGELASSQDQENFAKVTETRREKFAEPRILRPFVNKMQSLGLLPKGKYDVVWGSLFTPTTTEKATIASTIATAINMASGGAPETIMDGDTFGKRYLDYEKPKAIEEQIVEALNGDGSSSAADELAGILAGTPNEDYATALYPKIEGAWKASIDALSPSANDEIKLEALRMSGGSFDMVRTKSVLSNNLFYANSEHDNSAMICFDIPEVIRQELKAAYPQMTDDVYDNLHLTLVYIGDYRTIEAASMITALDIFAFGQSPVKGILQGVARFVSGGEKDALVVTFDSPQMPELYAHLTECLKAAGVPYHKDHGFIPHVTLDYIGKDDALPIDTIAPIEVNFNTVYLAKGETDWTPAMLQNVSSERRLLSGHNGSVVSTSKYDY